MRMSKNSKNVVTVIRDGMGGQRFHKSALLDVIYVKPILMHAAFMEVHAALKERATTLGNLLMNE